MSVNSKFFSALGAPAPDAIAGQIQLMDRFRVEPYDLRTAVTFLRRIREVASESRRRAAATAAETATGDMPIVADHKKYGLPDIPETAIRIFIIGCGNRAKGYTDALLNDYAHGKAPYVIAGVADPVESRRQEFIEMARTAGIAGVDDIRQFGDWRDVGDDDFDDLKINVAFVMTLDQDHAEPAIKFMDHKCHVVVEKPLDATIDKIGGMVDAAKRNHVIATVCTVLEYTSHARQMKKLVSDPMMVRSILIREQVGWHHDAYAYGTGPFCDSKDTSTYTIAKTIHDMSMGLCLTGDEVDELIYIPSKSLACRGESGEKKIPENVIYDPESYLCGSFYIRKLIAQMRGNEILDKPEHDISEISDMPVTTIDEIIEAVTAKDDDGDYVMSLPDVTDDADSVDGADGANVWTELEKLTDAELQRIADVYRPFHLFLCKTNYWFNPMMYRAANSDQPAGFTIVANMKSGCQFTMVCSIHSSKVCVRHYQIRSPYGEVVSDAPTISATRFGKGGVDIPATDDECAVPDESNISRNKTHGGADGMFSHDVMRKIGHAIDKAKAMERDGHSQEDIDAHFDGHELSGHFERNAKLTMAIIQATNKPNVMVEVGEIDSSASATAE